MPIADTIRDKLTEAFTPSHLVIVDDSGRHAGHSGATRDDGSRGETHFTVHIVSDRFAGLSRVDRQRRVYDILSEELSGPVHALSLTALTLAESSSR